MCRAYVIFFLVFIRIDSAHMKKRDAFGRGLRLAYADVNDSVGIICTLFFLYISIFIYFLYVYCVLTLIAVDKYIISCSFERLWQVRDINQLWSAACAK